MSQSWPTITGPSNVSIADLTARLDALRSLFSGATAPATAVVGQLFYDTGDGFIDVCTNATGPVFAALATALSAGSVAASKLAAGAAASNLGFTPLDSATYTAADVLAKLLTVDGSGSGLDADTLDGHDTSYFLAASGYTAADVLAKLLTVDGSGSGLDADTLDGHDTSYFQVALGYTPLNSTAYTAADVLSKLLTVDGSGSGLDADTLDGHDTSYFQVALGYTPLNSTSYTAADVLSKLLTVDGSGSGLDADLLDGQSSAYFLAFANFTGTLAAGAFPILTGDVTTAGGALATTLGATAVTARTADTAPDMAADYLLSYDASATALKKVLMQYIGAGKQAFWVPAGSMAPRASNGCAALATLETTTNKVNYDHLAFDATTQEFATFDWKAPKSISTGTVTFIPVWSHAATSTNFGVVWGLSGAGRSDTDAMDIAMGTAVTSTDTGGTTDTLYIAPVTGACTIGGTFAAEDLIKFQISRNPADASDTMAIDARLHGVLVIVTTTQNTEV